MLRTKPTPLNKAPGQSKVPTILSVILEIGKDSAFFIKQRCNRPWSHQRASDLVPAAFDAAPENRASVCPRNPKQPTPKNTRERPLPLRPLRKLQGQIKQRRPRGRRLWQPGVAACIAACSPRNPTSWEPPFHGICGVFVACRLTFPHTDPWRERVVTWAHAATVFRLNANF